MAVVSEFRDRDGGLVQTVGLVPQALGRTPLVGGRRRRGDGRGRRRGLPPLGGRRGRRMIC